MGVTLVTDTAGLQSLQSLQGRINRDPYPGDDDRKTGIIVPSHAVGWSQSSNAPGGGSPASRIGRFVPRRNMRIAGAIIEVTSNASTNDDIDFNIYDEDFDLIVNTGSTAGLLNSGSVPRVTPIALFTTKTWLYADRTYRAPVHWVVNSRPGRSMVMRVQQR
jgi:hypothetical protein